MAFKTALSHAGLPLDLMSFLPTMVPSGAQRTSTSAGALDAIFSVNVLVGTLSDRRRQGGRPRLHGRRRRLRRRRSRLRLRRHSFTH